MRHGSVPCQRSVYIFTIRKKKGTKFTKVQLSEPIYIWCSCPNIFRFFATAVPCPGYIAHITNNGLKKGGTLVVGKLSNFRTEQ